MSKKWTHAIISCFEFKSYSLDGFYIRRGQEVPVDDPALVEKLKKVRGLGVSDVFEEPQEEKELDSDKKSKKGK